ncbi:MAG: hypothetical protein OXU25_07280 [Thaumarchaeota archaeon]|nr:hypothetical protein [Nitrososphaerota archaeon]
MDDRCGPGRIDVTAELGPDVFAHKSGIESLYETRQVAGMFGNLRSPHAATGGHVGGAWQEVSDSQIVIGRQFHRSVPLPHGVDYACPWATAAAVASLARQWRKARLGDATRGLFGLDNPQGNLDLEHGDAIGDIRAAARALAASHGTVVTHGVCSPSVLDWTVRNAAVHGHCPPNYPTPHVSGMVRLPGGTEILMATDATLTSDRMVLFNPRDALRLYEGPKRVEFQWGSGPSRLVAVDEYGFVGIKRDLITGARTAMTFGIRMPPGSPPGSTNHGLPPACGAGAGAGSRIRLGPLAANGGSMFLGHYVKEHAPEWVDLLGRWVIERLSGAAVTRA